MAEVKDGKTPPKRAALPGEKPGSSNQLPLNAAPASAPAKPAEPAKPAPAADAKPEPGPDNGYGIAEPTSHDPMDWVRYDEDVANAKAKFDKEHAPAKDAKAKPAESDAATTTDGEPTAAEKPASAEAPKDGEPAAKPAEELQPPPPRQTAKGLPADDQFELEPGNKWTRAQIVNEIVGGKGAATELRAMRDLFGTPNLQEAKRRWEPLLKLTRETPGLTEYLDAAIKQFQRRQSDPDYAAFLDDNETNFTAWRKENPQDPATRRAPISAVDADPSAAEKPPKWMEPFIARWQAEDRQRRFNDIAAKIKTEREGLWASYPILGEDQRLWKLIYDHAMLTARQHPEYGYTLTDSVRDNWSAVTEAAAYKQWRLAQSGEGAKDKTPMPVRAGGADSGEVRTAAAAPKSDGIFRNAQGEADSQAATDAWLREHPNGFSE